MADDGLVYSTEKGDLRRGQKRSSGSGRSGPTVPADGIVRIHRDRAGRGGKTVTLVTGLPGSEAQLKLLAAELKRLCGSGGAIRERNLEIQGDHRERVAAHLEERGHRVKLAGG
jgi:translation initiation factor 1